MMNFSEEAKKIRARLDNEYKAYLAKLILLNRKQVAGNKNETVKRELERISGECGFDQEKVVYRKLFSEFLREDKNLGQLLKAYDEITQIKDEKGGVQAYLCDPDSFLSGVSTYLDLLTEENASIKEDIEKAFEKARVEREKNGKKLSNPTGKEADTKKIWFMLNTIAEVYPEFYEVYKKATSLEDRIKDAYDNRFNINNEVGNNNEYWVIFCAALNCKYGVFNPKDSEGFSFAPFNRFRHFCCKKINEGMSNAKENRQADTSIYARDLADLCKVFMIVSGECNPGYSFTETLWNLYENSKEIIVSYYVSQSDKEKYYPFAFQNTMTYDLENSLYDSFSEMIPLKQQDKEAIFEKYVRSNSRKIWFVGLSDKAQKYYGKKMEIPTLTHWSVFKNLAINLGAKVEASPKVKSDITSDGKRSFYDLVMSVMQKVREIVGLEDEDEEIVLNQKSVSFSSRVINSISTYLRSDPIISPNNLLEDNDEYSEQEREKIAFKQAQEAIKASRFLDENLDRRLFNQLRDVFIFSKLVALAEDEMPIDGNNFETLIEEINWQLEEVGLNAINIDYMYSDMEVLVYACYHDSIEDGYELMLAYLQKVIGEMPKCEMK